MANRRVQTGAKVITESVDGGIEFEIRLGADVSEGYDDVASRVYPLSQQPKPDFGKCTTKEIGDLGEQLSIEMLQRNGYTDTLPIQNASGNGVDIAARTPDGRVAFFEVKASGQGNVADLKPAQRDFDAFVGDRLGRAASQTGGYEKIGDELADRALEYLRDYGRDPSKATGAAVGVDLKSRVIRVSPWKKPGEL
jgi:hypothetical protein